MAWPQWNVFIHLGTTSDGRDDWAHDKGYPKSVTVRHREPPRLLCVVKARNKDEAEVKGDQHARRGNIRGLIDVEQKTKPLDTQD